MILFHAQYPYPHLLQGGMYVRFYAIEQFFRDRERVYFWEDRYLDTFRIKEEHPTSNCTYYVYNPFIAEHRQFIYDLVRRADFVYCQTQYYSYLITHILDSGKAVVDLHGIPPEESEMEGQPRQAEYCSIFEKEVVAKSRCLISVTESMIGYLENKYGGRKIPHIVMPIMNDLSPCIEKTSRDKIRVVYAGDVAAWQKVDQMLETIRRARCPERYEFVIYTRKMEEMRALCSAYGVLEMVSLSSYDPKDAQKVLSQTDIGFVLRDDSPVNRVACPTKMMEYLQFGVVPIVSFAEIGDFQRAGYRYITVDAFERGEFSLGDLQRIREDNRKVYECFHRQFLDNIERLRALCVPRTADRLIVSGYDANLAIPLNVRVRFKYGAASGEEVVERHHLMGSYREDFKIDAPKPGFFAVEVIPMLAPVLFKRLTIRPIVDGECLGDGLCPANFTNDENGYGRSDGVPCYYLFFNDPAVSGVALSVHVAAALHELHYYDVANDMRHSGSSGHGVPKSRFWDMYIRVGWCLKAGIDRALPKQSRRRRYVKAIFSRIASRG